MKIESARWFVIGCPERNMFMRWEIKDHRNGSYVDTGDVMAADRFPTRAEAASRLRPGVDKDVQAYVKNREGVGVRVCRVERVTQVI